MLFGPKKIKDVEREIRKLEIWLNELNKKREWILNKIEEIERKEGNVQLINVINRLRKIERKYYEIQRKIPFDILQALQNGEGEIVDATKVNPNILKEFQIAKKEKVELEKQQRYFENLLKEEKISKVHSLNHEYIRIMKKYDEINKRLKALKMARKR